MSISCLDSRPAQCGPFLWTLNCNISMARCPHEGQTVGRALAALSIGLLGVVALSSYGRHEDQQNSLGFVEIDAGDYCIAPETTNGKHFFAHNRHETLGIDSMVNCCA